MNRNYSVFLSHAGPDNECIAIPLYERLRERNIHAFLDREEVHVGDNGPRVMEYAMNTAPVGVFILSPEFTARGNILFFIHLHGSLRPLLNKVKALTNVIRTILAVPVEMGTVEAQLQSNELVARKARARIFTDKKRWCGVQ